MGSEQMICSNEINAQRELIIKSTKGSSFDICISYCRWIKKQIADNVKKALKHKIFLIDFFSHRYAVFGSHYLRSHSSITAPIISWIARSGEITLIQLSHVGFGLKRQNTFLRSSSERLIVKSFNCRAIWNDFDKVDWILELSVKILLLWVFGLILISTQKYVYKPLSNIYRVP